MQIGLPIITAARSSYRRVSVRRSFLGSRQCYSSQPNEESRFTIWMPPNLSKTSAIEALHGQRHKRRQTAPSSGSLNAAAVLTTPGFAKWLEDEHFMSALLGLFSAQDMSVLAAVVDGLCPNNAYGSPRAGFSALGGYKDTLLPGLWDRSEPQVRKPGGVNGYVEFSMDCQLNVTMPLANTVFQNGREATLLACKWEQQDHGSFSLSQLNDKAHQRVVCGNSARPQWPRTSVPLIPLSSPRKMTACLGNIVSLIEVEGSEMPASTELEAIVQNIYNRRFEAQVDSSRIAVEVWALILPHLEQGHLLKLDIPSATAFGDAEQECALAWNTSTQVASLLSSGCELYRIKSGGGGWDKRRGRLALEIDWNSPKVQADELDLPPIFDGLTSTGILQKGIVRPGSYIQFFTSPLLPIGLNPKAHFDILERTTIGTCKDFIEETDNAAGKIEYAWEHFGALSKEGIFVAASEIVPATDKQRPTTGRMRSQIDSPFSYISSR